MDDPETCKPGLRTRIEQLRDQQQGRSKASPAPKKGATEDSKTALIQTLKQRIRRLEAEIQGLRHHIEVVTGQSLQIPELERQIQALATENQRLNTQLETNKNVAPRKAYRATANRSDLPSNNPTLSFEGIQHQLQSLGITWNRTIEKAISAATPSDLQRAIASLQEQQTLHPIQNPNGFLVAALRDPNWKPSDNHQAQQEKSLFKAWFDLAQPLGLVIASQLIDQIQHVITPDYELVPFAEFLEQYPMSALEEMGEILNLSNLSVVSQSNQQV
ncbi:hypothetical protein ACQ4M3_37235 [Leptolyngbya sp. AN03gr2]|uniref:hypothetical protein n=1 Tax=unclassified Leptolyngbya TaxID=2650499 RepID=UPI003D31996D